MTRVRLVVACMLVAAACAPTDEEQPRLADGAPCTAAEACASGHCQNGFCCAAGDCCALSADCPSGWTVPSTCGEPATCQGTRADATCLESTCGTSEPIADDTGCGAELQALDCTPYPAVFCQGGEVQAPPECSTGCEDDAGCVEGYHCTGTCQVDLADGFSCTRDGECASGHCQNAFCCAAGDCCAAPEDCPEGYTLPLACTAPATCQGERRDALCEGSTCAIGPTTEDDSGCALVVASDCGPWPAVFCTAEAEQTAPACATTCAGAADCDPGAHCSAGGCEWDHAVGDPCTGDAGECADAATCVDGVCCSTACPGTCERCDLAGTAGTCTAIPEGSDPDGECGGVDCAAYYWGWSGDTCYARADVPDGSASCAGDRTCQTPAQLCPDSGMGNATLTCNATCEDPVAGTCTGITPGACIDVNPGTTSCGTGACLRTAPICVGGLPNACIPGVPSAETCDDVDQDCDGTIDEGIAGAVDGYEPNEACTSPRNLGTVAEADSEMSWAATIYPSGDQDHFVVFAEEGAHTCFPFTSQSYSIRVRLAPPSTSGDCVDYDLYLRNDACGALASSIAAGCAAETVLWTWDGVCGANDSLYLRIGVQPWGGAWECVPYTLYADMWAN